MRVPRGGRPPPPVAACGVTVTRAVVWAVALAVAWVALPAAALAQGPPRGVDLSRPVTYFVASGADAPGFREGDRTLAEWALRVWARQLDPAATVVPASEADALVRVYWVSAADGLYGETRPRVVDGRPGADVFVHPDTDALGGDVARAARTDALFRDAVVYLTCVHELGHAFGLPHTRAFPDIMYSFQYGGDFVAYFMRFRRTLRSRDDIRDASPFSEADRSALRAEHGRR